MKKETTQKDTKGKVLKGVVVSNKMKDTVVVRIERYEKHPRYKKYRDWETDRKSTRLNSSHSGESRMPSSA